MSIIHRNRNGSVFQIVFGWFGAVVSNPISDSAIAEFSKFTRANQLTKVKQLIWSGWRWQICEEQGYHGLMNKFTIHKRTKFKSTEMTYGIRLISFSHDRVQSFFTKWESWFFVSKYFLLDLRWINVMEGNNFLCMLEII